MTARYKLNHHDSYVLFPDHMYIMPTLVPHLNLKLRHELNPTWESLSLQRDNLNCIDCLNITILIGYYSKYLFYQLFMYLFV